MLCFLLCLPAADDVCRSRVQTDGAVRCKELIQVSGRQQTINDTQMLHHPQSNTQPINSIKHRNICFLTAVSIIKSSLLYI